MIRKPFPSQSIKSISQIKSSNHFKLRYKSILTPIRMADDKVDPPPVDQEISKEKEEKEFEALTGTTEDGEKKEKVARSGFCCGAESIERKPAKKKAGQWRKAKTNTWMCLNLVRGNS